MNIEKLVLDLCAYDDEQEWFEFKENWFQPEVLGEYISALSNAAAFHYKIGMKIRNEASVVSSDIFYLGKCIFFQLASSLFPMPAIPQRKT